MTMSISQWADEGDLAVDEAIRLGWLDKPGDGPGPVAWMAAEIERLRAENAELRRLSPNGPRQTTSERSDCRPDERDMI